MVIFAHGRLTSWRYDIAVRNQPYWGLCGKEVEEMAARGTLSPPTSREQAAGQVVKRRSPLHHLLTNRVMWVAVALALIASLAYLMIEIGVLGVGPARGSRASSTLRQAVICSAGC